ncbi:caspase-2-like [Orbicella faveolata]|uniref:caspase-2-like n=1 Tax=Orbicella faveolata TaxID=48498 RepID=UPI0009E37454|nr:caspase-2-like [Orbicella faveolata]
MLLPSIYNLTGSQDNAKKTSEKHRNILRRCHASLVKDLEPKKLFPHLIQEGIMTSDDTKRINKIDKRKRQSQEFLSILPARGPRAYQEFVKALEEKQPSLACILLREEVVAAEAGRRDPINQFQENQGALNKSRNKHHHGRRRNSSKKTKNDKGGTSGNSLYTVMAFVMK